MSERTPSQLRRFALNRIRLATLFGMLPVVVESWPLVQSRFRAYLRYTERSTYDPEFNLPMADEALRLLVPALAQILLPLIGGIWLLFPLYRGLCIALNRWIFPGPDPFEWQKVCYTSLWTLPWAAAAGVGVWCAYEYILPKHEFIEIGCGVIGFGLGGWSFLTLAGSMVGSIRKSWSALPAQSDSEETEKALSPFAVSPSSMPMINVPERVCLILGSLSIVAGGFSVVLGLIFLGGVLGLIEPLDVAMSQRDQILSAMLCLCPGTCAVIAGFLFRWRRWQWGFAVLVTGLLTWIGMMRL